MSADPGKGMMPTKADGGKREFEGVREREREVRGSSGNTRR